MLKERALEANGGRKKCTKINHTSYAIIFL